MSDCCYNSIVDIKNSNRLIFQSDLAAVILDKYPKSKYHFVVLPWEDIHSVYQLTSEHVTLLEAMYQLVLESIKKIQLKSINFKYGFHMRLSMSRLHLHAISNDFKGRGMKRERHWTHFNTEFFISYKDVLDELKEYGTIRARSAMYIERLWGGPLLCNQCNYKTLPSDIFNAYQSNCNSNV
ncbi:aprataxin-like protein [Wyeomyia smithii]|uniref:aprataxin-like protein n=1 Tax=Wyeomyia smithii TaxID=174621 RepID=UPI002467B739|nr:aprataxin-like protein [Wyeomyia smithii]